MNVCTLILRYGAFLFTNLPSVNGFIFFRYQRTSHTTGFSIANSFGSPLINCILLFFKFTVYLVSFSFICTPTHLKTVGWFDSRCRVKLYYFCTDTTSLHIKQTGLLYSIHKYFFAQPLLKQRFSSSTVLF